MEDQIKHGLRENFFLFSILVLVNAFVGAMAGLERAVMPGYASAGFGIKAHTALLTFIMAFGLSKSLANLTVWRLSLKISRKKILLLGWLMALPVPFLLMYASSWEMVILANIFLGINQGLAWSATVIMKIDLVGTKNRGLAMGINEFAGYLAVGLSSWLASEIAARHGYIYFPFLPGVFFAFGGLLMTIFLVRDTAGHVEKESRESSVPELNNIWWESSWGHPNLGSVSLNGLLNNLNDGVIWGLLPVLLAYKHFNISQIGWIAGLYPAVWGISQLFTGKLGDHFCKKQIIAAGMILQAVALFLFTRTGTTFLFLSASVLLGFGTALVYPNFLAVIADNSHPVQRAASMSIFRFWRDSGYVIGALLSGWLADKLGLTTTFLVVALLTALGAAVAEIRMRCKTEFLSKRL